MTPAASLALLALLFLVVGNWIAEAIDADRDRARAAAMARHPSARRRGTT